MRSLNREDNDFDSVWRPAEVRSAMVGRIGKRMLRGAAVLCLAALLATGPLACRCAEPEPDEDATREEKPKYEW